MPPFGFLLVDKPAGPTSHDVVDRVRRLYGISKVGHAGTLDPPASGLLVLGLGRATRLLRYFGLVDKSYVTTFVFGVATSTLDEGSEVDERAPVSFGEKELQEALASFVGEIWQRPPAVSAVKIGGEPLYKKARKGEVVEAPARPRKIFDLRLLGPIRRNEDGTVEAPVAVRCDSGTYVRALAADVAAKLGTVGHLRSLRRVAVGKLRVESATSLEELEGRSSDGLLDALLAPEEALEFLPRMGVGEQLPKVAKGQRFRPTSEMLQELAADLDRVRREHHDVAYALARAGEYEVSTLGGGARTASGGADRSEEALDSTSDESLRSYRGPVALLDSEARIVAIARLTVDMLAFDCVLVGN